MNKILRLISKFVFTILVTFPSNQLFASPLLKLFTKGQKPGGFVFFASFIVAVFLAIAVHELGHLVAGLVQGFRFQLYVVGLLGITRTEQGTKLFVNRNIGYMGGIASTLPIRHDVNNRRKFSIVIIAGPIASLLFALICFACLSYGPATLKIWCLCAGASSIGIFIATVIPRKTGVFFTDRARFQRLISKGKESEIEEAMLEIIAQFSKDNSFKNIPVDKALLLQTDDETFIRFWGHYYAYKYYSENCEYKFAEDERLALLGLKKAVTKQIWASLKLDDEIPAVSGNQNN